MNTAIFLFRQGKSNRNTDKSAVCFYVHREFVFHCLLNASLRCLEKKSVSCMATLMSHFPMKGQNTSSFTRFFFFLFFFQCNVSFPSQWSSFFSIGSSLLLLRPLFFFLTGLPLSEKKTQRAILLDISPFSSFPHVVSSIHPSLSLSFVGFLSSHVPFSFRKMRSAVVL